MKSKLIAICLSFNLLGGYIFLSTSAIEISVDQAGVISRVTSELLAQLHFSNNKLDDQRSQNFLNTYLDSLDPRRMVFLKRDVELFERTYGNRLFDFIQNENASAAFVIFRKYIERLESRVELAHKLIDKEFDFTIDEDIQTDRSEEPWPANDGEVNELWRKRIKDEFLRSQTSNDSNEQIRKKLHKRYRSLLSMLMKYDNEEILQTFLSALGRTFDPHSSYMSPTEAKNFEIQNIDLSFYGIGAVLQYVDGYTQIVRLIPGGPAEESNYLKPKDRIVAVAQGDKEPVDTIEMKLSKVVDMIRGPRGTIVKLTVVPEDESETKVIELKRDKIKLEEQLARARLIEEILPSGQVLKIGVLDLNQFYDKCSDHLAQLIVKLKKEDVDGIILNLAGNSGGLLPEAQKVAGLFIKKGPIVQVREVIGRSTTLRDPNPNISYEGPLVVLTDKMSASASEIVAAALQDHERAIVVGNESTHGKGTVQTVLDLRRYIRNRIIDTPGKLKFTISKFYRIVGTTTQRDGVTPDIILPSVYDHMDLGEASLENALEADRIRSQSRFTPLDLVLDYVSELKGASEKRVKDNRDFKYVYSDIEIIKEKKDSKKLTLNKEKRKAEVEKNKKRIEDRKKERIARPDREGSVYELTMKDLEEGKKFKKMTSESLLEEYKNKGAINLEEEDDEDSPFIFLVDPYLDETVNIIADYIGMVKKNNLLTANKALPIK